MRAGKPAATILPIQYLRGFAALLVIFVHASDQLRIAMPYNPKLGHFGVDIFFVISGFIMIFISDRKAPNPIQFFTNRIRRIVPIYWFYTSVTAVLVISMPSAFRGTEFTLSHYIQSLFFIAHEQPGNTNTVSPLLRLGWTLNYEMFFYALFAIAIAISFKSRLILTLLAITVLVLFGWLVDAGPVWRFYTGSIMLEFAFGMAIGAWFVIHGRPSAKLTPLFWLAAAGCIIWAEAIMWDRPTRGIVYGIPAAILVYLSLAVPATGEGFVGKALRNLGDASYSIYLSHLFPLAMMRIVWEALGLPRTAAANLLFVGTAMVAAAITGIFAYRLIERPLDRRARSLVSRTVPAPAVASS